MSIILKENEWAEQMIIECELGKNPIETLRRVCRYYIDNGCQEKDLINKLESFLLRCNSSASLPKWHGTLVSVIKYAKKYKAVDIDKIFISKSEMDTVSNLKSAPLRRLAFTLLCLAKYWNIVRDGNDSWVVSRGNEIMTLANISAPLKRQSAMYKELEDLGLVKFPKKVDSTSMQVCFVDNSDDVVFEVSDFRNLGYQYMMYDGGSFIVCQNCGIVTKANKGSASNNQKYCPECASKLRTKKRVESVMKSQKR